MEKKITFEDVIHSNWKTDLSYEKEDLVVKIRLDSEEFDEDFETNGILFSLLTCWDEEQIVSHDIKDSELKKLFNLLYHSKDMFKLLKVIDNEEARKLIEEIEKGDSFEKNKINYED